MNLDTLKKTTPAALWQIPSQKIELSKNDVHVWLATLDYPKNCVRELSRVLSQDEFQRADCFVFERDKNQFITRRGLLRTIIGTYYLGIDPSRVEFGYGTYDKPYLLNHSEEHALQFNLSDSHKLVLYAFIKDLEVGIDIEHMRYITDAQQIIDSSCSGYEKDAFNELAEREKQDAFFNCWTRKEAFIKAIGEGLYYPLDQFDVSLAPGEPARLLRVAGQPEEAVQWSLKSFAPEINYKAALAVKCNDCNTIYWRFPW